MQLESVTPLHGPLPAPGETGKDLVEIPSHVVADRNHCAVNEADSRASAEGIDLHESHQMEEHAGHEFHEAVVGNGIGKLLPELSVDTVEIVLLEVSVCAEMIAQKNGHYLTVR